MIISDIEVTAVHPERWGDDLDVVNSARVSFKKNSDWEYYPTSKEELEASGLVIGKRLKEGDVKLINYLAKHKHHSPFNHSFLSFRIKAPIFVARQLVKHKFMPWNEVSRRYVDEEPEFYFPDYWRKRAENVKQGSSEERCEAVYEKDITDMDDVEWATQDINACLSSYKAFLEKGVCPEQARMLLPLSAMTEWRWSGTLGAFLDMLVLRLDPHTQKETRDVAEQIAGYVKEYFPVSYEAYLGKT